MFSKSKINNTFLNLSSRKNFIFCILILSVIINEVAVCAKTTTLNELQDLPEAKDMFIHSNNKTIINPNHWTYKTLEHISKKYGLVLGNPAEKFDINKPLTRNEAAVMLVSLVGKIKEDNLQLSIIEKDRVSILKQEFEPELAELTGRVSMLEKEVNTLKGNITKLKENTAKTVRFNHADNLTLTGGVLARYSGIIKEGNTNYAPNFRIPVASIALKGNLNECLNYFAAFQPTRYYDGSKKTMMGDVYIATTIIPNNTIYFGQTRIPIGIDGTISDFKIDTIERTQIARIYSGTRDIGIKAVGKYKYFDYSLGAYNGTRYESVDNNKTMDLASWVNVKPLADYNQFGDLTIGTGYTSGKNTHSYNILGGYAEYKLGNLGLKYETAFSDGGYLNANQKSKGWYTTTTYDLTNKLQLLGRIDRFDPNTVTVNDKITEYTLGTNYFFKEQRLKLQANYVFVNNSDGGNHSRFVTQTQYLF